MPKNRPVVVVVVVLVVVIVVVAVAFVSAVVAIVCSPFTQATMIKALVSGFQLQES